MTKMTKKVLIVDDEPHIRLLLEQTLEDLEDEGAEILLASNGGEAMAIIKEERPDLVLLDVMMPVMNGFDVCRAVKADAALASTHIILLTAKGQAFDRAQGSEVGADRYMTKPFDPDEVLEVAAEVLGIEL